MHCIIAKNGETMNDKFLYVEKYRPKTIDECILPGPIKNSLKEYEKIGKIPNLLFEGPPGTGKTTAARALCETIGLDYMMINSSEERGIDMLRTKIVDFASSVSLTGKGKVVILDEADFLTPEAQAAFRGIVEKFPSNCTFILTCNYKKKLMDAIDSRMASMSFKFEKKESNHLKLEMFKRIKSILELEGVKYEDRAVAKLIEKFYPDFRKTLGELQKFSVGGTFDNHIVEQIGNAGTFNQLIEFTKAKDFNNVRKWMAENSDLGGEMIFRRIYDGLYEFFKPDSIPVAVLIIGKYQYQHAFVMDPEINLTAMMVELMVDCEFK